MRININLEEKLGRAKFRCGHTSQDEHIIILSMFDRLTLSECHDVRVRLRISIEKAGKRQNLNYRDLVNEDHPKKLAIDYGALSAGKNAENPVFERHDDDTYSLINVSPKDISPWEKNSELYNIVMADLKAQTNLWISLKDKVKP